MLKKFKNDFKKWVTGDGVVFNIGDKVISGRTKGAIVAISANGDFLLSNNAVVFADNVKHAPTVIPETKTVEIRTDSEPKTEPAPTKQTVSKSRRTKDDCEAEIARLNRKLEECNVERNLPAVVVQAPIEVQKSLPEVRKAELISEINEATVLFTENVRSGNQTEIKQTEKQIEKKFEELKEVSPQVTISASGGCRVVQGKAHGKDTIRIYFTERQNEEIKNLIMKQGFRWFQEKINGKTDYYWGAWYSDKLLAFAKEFCKGEEAAEETPIAKAEEKPTSARTTKKAEKSDSAWVRSEEQTPEYFIAQIAVKLKGRVSPNDKRTIIYKCSVKTPNGYHVTHLAVDFKKDGTYLFRRTDGTFTKLSEELSMQADHDVRNAMNDLKIRHLDLEIKSETKKESPKTETSKPSPSKITLSPLLKELMPKHQQRYLEEVRGDGVKDLKPSIADLEKQIATIRERQSGKQAIVKAHYFYGGSDWYVTEYEGNGIVYGFAILNGDYDYSEFGSASIEEFNQTGKVELDFYWTPKPLDEVLYKKNSKYYPKPKSMEKNPPRPNGHPSKGGEFGGASVVATDATSKKSAPETKKSSKDDKQGEDVLKTIRETMERIAAAAQARAANTNA